MNNKRWRSVSGISSMMSVKPLKSLRSVTKRGVDDAIVRRGANERRRKGLSMNAREPYKRQIMNARSCRMQRKGSEIIENRTVSWANSRAS